MNTIDFLEELSKRKEQVWPILEQYLQIKEPVGHYEMIREYPLRQGKYLRPGLLLLALEMWAGEKRESPASLHIAAAMQASEEWLLIHDDIEDYATKRRNKPALNIFYGVPLALNAGDALHIIMWKILADGIRKLKSNTGWTIYEKINEILLTTTEGQYLELAWIHDKKVYVSEAEYLDMIKRKTAYYSIIGPLQLGVILAGGSQKDLDAIARWGLPFGYAFQMANDCMGIEEDIIEGKRTLILSHLLASCQKSEKALIEKIYIKHYTEKTISDRKYVLKLIKKYRSDTYVQTQAKKYINEATKIFKKETVHLPDTEAKKIILAGMKFIGCST